MITKMENTYEINEKVPELRFAHLAPDVWDALHDLKRTGWVNRGVMNPESVQEHVVDLRNIASHIEGLTEEEKDGLLDMLKVHDWPEAIRGDEVILTLNEDEFKALKGNKFESEKVALRSICEKLGEDGKIIMNLWLRFETSQDSAASFARQLDKYQAIEKALEYEKIQDIPMFKEFLDHAKARNSITHPILLKKLELLEKNSK
jgi:5'-deoxynucleotidase YfbR-like HD superfamily hydrolase